MQFKRGDKVRSVMSGEKGIILGPEDFEGYNYNRPGDKWELVGWANPLKDKRGRLHRRTWNGNIWLEQNEV